VIMNLCTNAYHAMQEKGGILKISLKQIEMTDEISLKKLDLKSAKYNCMTISDTGIGINEETLKRIFEPYFTTKEKGKGTGLGLALVHGIVKSFDGEISVYSKPGKGTTFEILLPIHTTSEDISKEKSDIDLHQLRGHEHVLFVDDEEPLVKWGKAALERLGYSVTTRTSSIETLGLFRETAYDFDIVITDMTMPNMTGYEMATKMKEIRPDIQIVLCTGFSEIVSEEKARIAGIEGYIKKPVVINDLAYAIRRLLDKKEPIKV